MHIVLPRRLRDTFLPADANGWGRSSVQLDAHGLEFCGQRVTASWSAVYHRGLRAQLLVTVMVVEVPTPLAPSYRVDRLFQRRECLDGDWVDIPVSAPQEPQHALDARTYHHPYGAALVAECVARLDLRAEPLFPLVAEAVFAQNLRAL